MSPRYWFALLIFISAFEASAAKIRHWPLPTSSNVAQPSLSQTPKGDIVLSWIQRVPEGGHSLQMSMYSPQGKWSPIHSIASGKNFFVNWADFPSTQALPDGSIWAHNLEKSGKGTYSYDVVIRRSQDQGKTWTPGLRVNAPVQAEHGFVTLWPWSKNQLGLVWLDGAAAASAKEEHAEHGHGGSLMSIRAAVIDSDMQKNLEWPIDLSTCDCCQTDVAITTKGPIVVYRDRSKDEIRDIYTTRYDGTKWTAPKRVHADQWLMPACPVNGPAITAYQNKVWVSWFTSAIQPSVRIAYSSDAGENFAPMREVAIKNVHGRVDVLSDKDSVWLSWMAEENDKQTVWLAQYSHDLKTERQRFALPAVVGNGRATGFPRMQLVKNNIYMVWTDIQKGKPQLRGYIVSP